MLLILSMLVNERLHRYDIGDDNDDDNKDYNNSLQVIKWKTGVVFSVLNLDYVSPNSV